MKTFKKFLEDVDVPTMNIGSGHIAGTSQAGDDPPRQPTKKKRPIIGNLFRRKKLNG